MSVEERLDYVNSLIIDSKTQLERTMAILDQTCRIHRQNQRILEHLNVG